MPNYRHDIDPDYVVSEYQRRKPEGRGMRSLARELKCSMSVIKRILREADVEIEPAPHARDYMAPEEIERTREIHGMWQRGGSCASIARDLGIKAYEVSWRLLAAQVGRFDIPVSRRSQHTFGESGSCELWMTPDQRREVADRRNRRDAARRGEQWAIGYSVSAAEHRAVLRSTGERLQ